ncbi:MAG: O-antigen ligase family protein [Acidobacteriota bacterium]|nr:O-antigen ligase family protein [Acidobacteriota bacterium]
MNATVPLARKNEARKNASPAPYTPPTPPPTPAVQSNSVQNLGFAVLLPCLLLIHSRASEFIDADGRFHLVMILCLVAGLAVLVTGGVFRALASRAGIWLTAFTVWLIVALPFSSWRGGSFSSLTDAWLKSYAMFLITAGLIFSFSQCRKTIFTLAVATAIIVGIALKGGLENAEDSRLAMSYGTLGNANDLAGQLMMGLPFCLYVAFEKNRALATRLFFFAVSALLLVVIFKTGSRGGLLTLIAIAAMFFWKISMSGKLKFGVVLLCILAVTPALLPHDVRERYTTIFSDRQAAVPVDAITNSAMESTEARQLLLVYSLELTMQHPVFGVGLEQFANAAWDLAIARKEPSVYHPVHNIFALIASETGIPALIFYLLALFASFRTLMSLRKASKPHPSLEHISTLAFCLLISLTAFTLSGLFNTNAYTSQFPILAGLITALAYTARPEIAACGARTPASIPTHGDARGPSGR